MNVEECKFFAPCGLCTYKNCECTALKNEKETLSCWSYHIENGKPVCWGTRNREECTCGGNAYRCDFYPDRAMSIKAARGIR